MIEVTRERKLQFHLAMLKDSIEMQQIREAVAEGKTVAEACSTIIGGTFNLSAEVEVNVLD
jgi:hypothetical protein